MKRRGSVTVEAAIVLPLYILVMAFIINFLNIFYLRLVVTQGLNNAAAVLGEYCHAVDLTLGMENFTLSAETSEKADALAGALDGFKDSAAAALEAFGGGISMKNLGRLIDGGRDFVGASANLANKLKSVDGEDVKNYLLTTAAETGGGTLVESMVDGYLTRMKVNRGLLRGDIRYSLSVDGADGRYDLILGADYVYDGAPFSMFFGGFRVSQRVVVHPWIGGKTAGVRG